MTGCHWQKRCNFHNWNWRKKNLSKVSGLKKGQKKDKEAGQKTRGFDCVSGSMSKNVKRPTKSTLDGVEKEGVLPWQPVGQVRRFEITDRREAQITRDRKGQGRHSIWTGLTSTNSRDTFRIAGESKD